MLTLAAWGERDPLAFPWLTLPSQDSIDAARQLLVGLDAVDNSGALTTTGQRMLALPLHPRISRFLVAAAEMGVASQAAVAAALLTERDPFRTTGSAGTIRGRSSGKVNRGNASSADRSSGSDIVDKVDQMQAFTSGTFSGEVNVGAAKQVQRVAKQLNRLVDSSVSRGELPDDEALMRALAAAYPDRVAKRRQSGSDRGVMVGGRGVKLDGRSNVRSSELFLCIDVDSRGSETLVRAASKVEFEWLDERLIREVDEPFFNPSLKAVVARRRRYFNDLLLAESPIECRPSPEVAELLFQKVQGKIDQLLEKQNAEVANWIQRVRFLMRHMPDHQLPLLDEAAIKATLRDLCASRTSVAQIQSAPWLDHLRGRYDYAQQQMIQQHAPDKLTVPSGNSIRIQYADGKPPVMKVRIQELFGWAESPRIAGGNVTVQLHLLGPNRRGQQITEDLQNFWESTYTQVRKDLRRRYPKHHWPEDPKTAKATRNGLKPR